MELQKLRETVAGLEKSNAALEERVKDYDSNRLEEEVLERQIKILVEKRARSLFFDSLRSSLESDLSTDDDMPVLVSFVHPRIRHIIMSR